MCQVLQVARLAGIEAGIVSKARLAGQHIEDKLQVIHACSPVLVYCLMRPALRPGCLHSGCCSNPPNAPHLEFAELRDTPKLYGMLWLVCNLDVYMQVSFSQNPPAHAATLLTRQAVSQLKHVLFACNASMATFKQAWLGLQETNAV